MEYNIPKAHVNQAIYNIDTQTLSYQVTPLQDYYDNDPFDDIELIRYSTPNWPDDFDPFDNINMSQLNIATPYTWTL